MVFLYIERPAHSDAPIGLFGKKLYNIQWGERKDIFNPVCIVQLFAYMMFFNKSGQESGSLSQRYSNTILEYGYI